MYFDPAHQEKDLRVLRKLVRDYPLGALITGIPSANHPHLQMSHIPFVLDVDDESSQTELGRLRGHLAKQNPQSKAMIESVQASPDNVLEQDVLVVFTSADHYVTPKFYAETKPSTGKVVPTWDYAAVQVYGRARIFHDSKSEEKSDFLQEQTSALSYQSETKIMGYTGVGGAQADWKLSDAPDKYLEFMKKNIIGIEITIDKMEGKFKMSQEKRGGDRQGVIQGFASLETRGAPEVYQMLKERNALKDQSV